jgi:hypothetical protein
MSEVVDACIDERTGKQREKTYVVTEDGMCWQLEEKDLKVPGI